MKTRSGLPVVRRRTVSFDAEAIEIIETEIRKSYDGKGPRLSFQDAVLALVKKA